MKKFLLFSFTFLTFFAQAQVFNRSIARGWADNGLLFSNTSNSTYLFTNSTIFEFDSTGKTVQTKTLPFKTDRRSSLIRTYKKPNGNILAYGAFTSFCDVVTSSGYYFLEFSPTLSLIDSSFMDMPFLRVAAINRMLKIPNNGYLIYSSSSLVHFSDNYDTLSSTVATNFIYSTPVYIGNNEILFRAGFVNGASTNQWEFRKYNLTTKVSTVVNLTKGYSPISATDTTFSLFQDSVYKMYTYNSATLSLADSVTLNFPSGFVRASRAGGLFQDALAFSDTSNLYAFDINTFALKGTYALNNPLGKGLLNIMGNQVMFVDAKNGYFEVEVGQLNQAPTIALAALKVQVENTRMDTSIDNSAPFPRINLNTDWKIKITNTTNVVLDSIRLVWKMPNPNRNCMNEYPTLVTFKNPLAVGDSFVYTADSIYFTQLTPINNKVTATFEVNAVMANGMVLNGSLASATVTQNTIGLKEQTLLTDVSLYPNPASESVYIKSAQVIQSVEIVNLQGQSIRTEKDINGISQISVEGLAKGIYLVKLKTDDAQSLPAGGVVVKKIVVE